MTLKKLLLFFMVLSILGIFGYPAGSTWKNPVLIAGDPNIKYDKPGVRFGPSGLVYVVYKYRDTPKGLTEIYLNTYDGEKVGVVGDRVNISDSPAFTSYEPDVYVTPDEFVHVSWCEYPKSNKTNHYVRYRYFDGVSWSRTFTLAQITCDLMEDVRVAVDNSGNAHVVFTVWPKALCYLASKYGDETRMSVFPEPGRSKHSDIGVDDNFIHVVWQFKAERYTVQYAKKENKLDGNWIYSASVVSRQDCGRPRIHVDEQGLPHFFYYEESDISRRLWYFYWNGTNYVGRETVLGAGYRLYHFSDIVVKNHSVAVSAQAGAWAGGKNIYYNYKKAGEDWSNVTDVPGVSFPKYQSIDLSIDGIVTAIAYQEKETAIYLLTNGDIKAGGYLKAAFNNVDMVFWGSNHTFDATPCIELNPGYNIVSYEWNFGDGSTLTTSNPIATHSFQTYGTDVRVTLKITAESGAVGNIYKDIHVHALYNGIVTSVVSRQLRTLFFNRPANEIRWTANPKNQAAGYPTITNYEIWRTSVGSGSNYTLITEVGADVTQFLDYQGLQSNVQYLYSIRSVDSEGHISPFDNL
jgi:hypothetical protein